MALLIVDSQSAFGDLQLQPAGWTRCGDTTIHSLSDNFTIVPGRSNAAPIFQWSEHTRREAASQAKLQTPDSLAQMPAQYPFV